MRRSNRCKDQPRVNMLRKISLNTSDLWKAIAIEVRIIGMQNKSTENGPLARPLRLNRLGEALDHFKMKFPAAKVMGYDKLEIIISRIVMFDTLKDEISRNF